MKCGSTAYNGSKAMENETVFSYVGQRSRLGSQGKKMSVSTEKAYHKYAPNMKMTISAEEV